MSVQAPQGAIVCSEPICERPVVRSANVCGLHLAESLRREGEDIPFQDTELSGMWATAVHVVRIILDGLSPELREPGVPSTDIDMYALFDPAVAWPMAHRALDLLGTLLTDEFGGMLLSPPMEYDSKILLRLRVAVPAPAADELIPRLKSAMETLFREVVGPDASWGLGVGPAEDPEGS
jgi:hypothetical protein